MICLVEVHAAYVTVYVTYALAFAGSNRQQKKRLQAKLLVSRKTFDVPSRVSVSVECWSCHSQDMSVLEGLQDIRLVDDSGGQLQQEVSLLYTYKISSEPRQDPTSIVIRVSSLLNCTR